LRVHNRARVELFGFAGEWIVVNAFSASWPGEAWDFGEEVPLKLD
jgi:hypothetical protein